MQQLPLPPLVGVAGSVRLPGSKSISNRILLLAALAGGTTRIHNLLACDDTARMLEALPALGIAWQTERDADGHPVHVVHGCEGRIPEKKAQLYLGNAGTAFRPLTAVLALAGGEYQLTGNERMHERPIADLVDALRSLGCRIDYSGQAQYPPLHIHPCNDKQLAQVEVRGAVSSQFVTALLIALPLLGRKIELHLAGALISRPYVDMTIELMARFGVVVERPDQNRFCIPAHARYRSPGECSVEGDASSASYFLAAAAIGGGPIHIDGVGSASIQGDIQFCQALEVLGAHIEYGADHLTVRAPQNGRLSAFNLDLNHIPDAAMTLAIAALFTDGVCRLRNIASWRVKETDRLHAMATELRKLGAEIEEGSDCITVTPPSHLLPATIDTYDDHRIAMCFSLATLGGVRIVINDPACVNKTFPDYFDLFARIARPAPIITIDGPGASGKGTIAARVAQALNFTCLDSGALYRLTALAAERSNIDLDDESALARLAANLPVRFDNGTVWLDRSDATQAIRSETCARGASRIARLPQVRAALLELQRNFHRAPGLVAEGRDMGSTVFPDAQHKFFLTASIEARAQRRYQQLLEKGTSANMSDLQQMLAERDAQDAARQHAPLKQWPDMQLVDTTNLDIAQTVSLVLEKVHAVSGD